MEKFFKSGIEGRKRKISLFSVISLNVKFHMKFQKNQKNLLCKIFENNVLETKIFGKNW